MVIKQTLVPEIKESFRSEVRLKRERKIVRSEVRLEKRERKSKQNFRKLNQQSRKDLDNILKWYIMYNYLTYSSSQNYYKSILREINEFEYFFKLDKFRNSPISEDSKEQELKNNSIYVPIKDDTMTLMQQNSALILEEFLKVISSLEQLKDQSVIINQIENLRLVIAFIKNSYEYGSLNFELYFGIEKELLSLVKLVEENEFTKALEHSLELKSVFVKIVENMSFLKKIGAPLLTFNYTGKEMEGMKIYQVKIN